MTRSTSPYALLEPEVSARRRALDRAVQRAVFGTLHWGTQHWLALVNIAAFVAFALPALGVPLMRLAGWEQQADAVFALFSLTCHQMPERSFFPFGQQMALCHRMSAIHGSFFAFGVAYLVFRGRLRPLPLHLMAAYATPMAVDGFTQLFGWRESVWELRVLTGTLFSLGVVWYTFPHFDLWMRLTERSLARYLATLR